MKSDKTYSEAVNIAKKINERADKCGYNWLPLLHMVTVCERPSEIADTLRKIYLDYSDFIFASYDSAEFMPPDNLRESMGLLRELCDVFGDMTPTDSGGFATSLHVDVAKK